MKKTSPQLLSLTRHTPTRRLSGSARYLHAYVPHSQPNQNLIVLFLYRLLVGGLVGHVGDQRLGGLLFRDRALH